MNIESRSHQDKAVVIGGSIGGLLAARVLSDFYNEVVVLDRDDICCEESTRRGVPQARHAHGLLAAGNRVIDDLFPGFSEEIIDEGAMRTDPQADGTWFFEGGPLFKTPSGTSGILTSRPLLESMIRRRVRALGRVKMIGSQSARELVVTPDGKRVTCVITNDRVFNADLIVDATGRGTKSPAWLKSLGYQPAPEEKVEVDLVYTTRLFRLGPNSKVHDRFMVIAPTPSGKRGGVMAAQEGDRWIVTLFGHFGQVAPIDLEGFVEYTRTLPSPLIYEAIRDAEPLDDGVNFRFPASTRRHYEEVKKFPDGYLVFGDAICSFNPIYGQGMSVAALQSIALRKVLQRGREDVARRFFRKAAAVIDNPWNIAVGGDLKMPETIGPRSTGSNLINWYISNVHKRAHSDPQVAVAFCHVAQLLASPTTLMRPGILRRVLAGIVGPRLRPSEKNDRSLLRTVEPRRKVPSDGF